MWRLFSALQTHTAQIDPDNQQQQQLQQQQQQQQQLYTLPSADWRSSWG